MKGLLWREFYLIRKQLRMILMFLIFYSVVFSWSHRGDFPVALWFMMLYVPIITYSSVYRDEQTGWYGHAVASGLSRRTVLLSQYLLFDLLLLLSLAVAWLTLLWVAGSGQDLVPVAYLRGLLYHAMACVFVWGMIPIILCWGAERSAWPLLGWVGGVFVLGLLVNNLNNNWNQVVLPVAQFWRAVLLVLAVAAAGQLLTFPLTLKAFCSKEL